MPQINQLAEVAYSQFFWLLLVLAIIYIGIGHGLLPRIQSTVDARDRRVADDLAAAQGARTGADEIEADYRSRMDAGRVEAMKLVQESKAASARTAEERIRAAGSEIAARTEEAEARIREAEQAALADIETVAAEAARDMVQRLAGLKVSPEKAAQAVKASLHG
ncbi:MAG: F-type H+-transporting ATPase subunit b [Sphingomonadales bacterium]|jgi:F-type H+-transporting ATPase subunit b|nr:F-type H+-transporting ATPase subunit b [Sphingomonadales bacterium]